MRLFNALLLTGTLLASAASAGTPVGHALPLHIGGQVMMPSYDNHIKGYTHQWPGTYFEGRFKGKEVSLRLNDKANILNVYVDGQKIQTINRPGEGDIVLGPFADTEHTIRVEKLTEAAWTSAQFFGFFVTDPANVLPAPEDAPRQIEFIGDSYTVGYGNTSLKRECPGDQVWATTNTQKAFGPLTAKHFTADYRVNAISGRGIVRNYNGGEGTHLPQAYLYALFNDTYDLPYAAPVQPGTWAPQIVVIGLGTNDFSTPLNPGEKWKTRNELHDDYEQAYVQFVKSLRAKYPGAYFVLMATDQANGEIQSEVKKVLATLRAGGESRIDFLPMNGLTFGGCDWHPTTADDAQVANSLIAFIEAKPEIWDNK